LFAGGEHAPLIRTSEAWFRQFKNGDLIVKESAHSGRPQSAKTRNAGGTG
jgi:hypothetical protein